MCCVAKPTHGPRSPAIGQLELVVSCLFTTYRALASQTTASGQQTEFIKKKYDLDYRA